MKLAIALKSTLFLMLVFILSGGSLIAQVNENDYYYVEGERIYLYRSETVKALKLRSEATRSARSTLSSEIVDEDIGTVVDLPILQKYDIICVYVDDSSAHPSLQQQLLGTSARDIVEAENPVYRIGKVNQVLVNEFIVQFKPGVPEKEQMELLEQNQLSVVEKSTKISGRYTISCPNKSAEEGLQLINAVARNPKFAFCEPNFIRIMPKRPNLHTPAGVPEGGDRIAPSATPQDSLFGNQWYLDNSGATGGIADADVDAPEAWEINQGISEIVVAIIDEGVDTGHPDLAAKIVTPYDAVDGDDNQEPNPWDGHGTSCAGIAAASTDNGNGVAGIGWGVRIMPVRIAYSSSRGGPWNTSNTIIEDGLRTAVDRGAQVLSNSWGGGSPSSAINAAVDYAIANNRVVIFAAGNEASSVSYPANLADTRMVIAVSATNEWDQFKTPTSNDGEGWGSNFGPEVTIAAPGVHMYTTDISGADGYVPGDYISNFNGTSSATPLVAGAAALVLSQDPSLTPSEVKSRLQFSADDLGAIGFDNQFGHGRLNVCNALGGACSYMGIPPDDSPGGDAPSCAAIGSSASPGGLAQTALNILLLCSTVLLLLGVIAYERLGPGIRNK